MSVAKLTGKHPNLNLVAFGKPNTFFKGFKRPMELDNQISCVRGSDLIATIPRFFYGPSKSQTMLYFANSGKDYISPDKAFRKKDRKIGGTMLDHLMPGYTERLEAFLGHQVEAKNIAATIIEEETKELNKLLDEVEDANG